jgi:DNA-binding transcriptional MerR regulator
MIMQLDLFGEEPVEAPIIAPIKEVVPGPKKYRLVPPSTIISETVDSKNKVETEKEKKTESLPNASPEVKKEKKTKAKAKVSTGVIPEIVTKAGSEVRKTIALDLFAEILPVANKIIIQEIQPEELPTLIAIPEVILEVVSEEVSEVIPAVIPAVIPEVIPAVVPEVIPEEVSEVIPAVVPEVIPEVVTAVIPEVIPEVVPAVIPEVIPEPVKEKRGLRVPKVITEIITEPIQVVEAIQSREEQNDIIKEEIVQILPETTQEITLEIFPKEVSELEPATVKSNRGRHPISQFQADVLLINIPDDEILFSKQYYPISEVAAMFNVKVSLLRFWENEFDILKPRKNRKGDRLFRPEDVKNLKLIYFLLRERKYTIEGAKMFIKKGKNVNEKFAAIESLKKIKGMLMELKAGLSF